MSANLNLSPPWISYVHKIESLFNGDEDVIVQYDNEEVALKFFVNDEVKAEAISKLLPMQKEFGNVILTITVYPPNEYVKPRAAYFGEAFEGNPNVVDIITIEDVPGMIISNPITYVIFRKEVVQYYNDDLGDAHGVCSTLYQDIAKRVLKDQDSIYYCTDTASLISTAAGNVLKSGDYCYRAEVLF